MRHVLTCWCWWKAKAGAAKAAGGGGSGQREETRNSANFHGILLPFPPIVCLEICSKCSKLSKIFYTILFALSPHFSLEWVQIVQDYLKVFRHHHQCIQKMMMRVGNLVWVRLQLRVLDQSGEGTRNHLWSQPSSTLSFFHTFFIFSSFPLIFPCFSCPSCSPFFLSHFFQVFLLFNLLYLFDYDWNKF